MKNIATRKDFLLKGIMLTTGLTLATKKMFALNQEKPAPIDSKIVNEFVKVAHADLDKVKDMLKQHPLLLNAAWDWGGGDFETALVLLGIWDVRI